MKRHFVTFSRLASVLVLILYLQGIQVTPALAATCTWDNNIGNWSDTTHWSCGAVPGAGDTATIQNGTVTLDVDATVAVLNLRDLGQLDGSSNLTITQAGEWSGSNPKMTGTGKTILAAGAVMTITGMSAGNGGWFRSFDNYGTLIISGPDGSRLDLASMTLTNKPGGVVDIRSNRYWMQYGGAVFANEGTLLKTTAGWADLGGITLNHSGTLSITTGGLQIASGAWSGAVWLNDAAATLKPNHTDCQLNAGTTFHGPGQVIVGGATLNGDVTLARLVQEGTLTGGGNLTVTQTLNWSGAGAKMEGAGKTTLAAGAVMTLTGNSAGNGGLFRSFDNYGTLIISGPDSNRLDLATMTLTNKPGGVVDIQSNRYWMWYGGATRPVFANEGTLLKTTAGWADLGGITLNHSGTLSITTGGLQIASGAWSGAAWLNDAAATLKLNHTDCQLNAGTTFHGPGQVIVGGATVNGNVTLANLVLEGTLTGGGNLTVTQTLNWSGWGAKMEGAGKTTLAADAVMTVTGMSAGNGGWFRSFDNYGTLIIGGPDGNRLDLASMTLTNKPGGVVDIRSNRYWMWYGGATRPVFANEGTLLKTTAGWADLGETQVNNTGVMSLTTGGVTLRYSHHNGRVYLNNAEAGVNLEGADNRLSTGAVFSGPGWLYSRGTTLVSGAVTVANLEHANGTLTLGDPTAVNLTVTGEFSRTGGTFQAFNNSTVTFGGTQPRLNLNTVTAFYNLAVLTGTTLIEVNPANYASFNGALVNHGTIRKTQAIAGPGPVLFGLTGVSMTVETAGTLSAVQVDRLDASHPQAGLTAATGRYWRITPTGTGYTVTLTLPHTLTAPVIVMHRYKNGAWNWLFGTTVTANAITCANLTELSDWAVGTVQRIFIPLVLRNQ